MRLVVRPRAADDLRTAYEHYAAIDPDLGDGFRDEFEVVVDRLGMFPLSGRPVEGVHGVRRARMRRFPYGVFYRTLSVDEIRILRVLHASQDRSRALQDEGCP